MYGRLLTDNEIRERFRKLRQQVGSQPTVAKAMGVTQPTISGWELGPGPIPKERLEQMAQMAGVPVSYLLVEEGVGDPEVRDRRIAAEWMKRLADQLESEADTMVATRLAADVADAGEDSIGDAGADGASETQEP